MGWGSAQGRRIKRWGVPSQPPGPAAAAAAAAASTAALRTVRPQPAHQRVQPLQAARVHLLRLGLGLGLG